MKRIKRWISLFIVAVLVLLSMEPYVVLAEGEFEEVLAQDEYNDKDQSLNGHYISVESLGDDYYGKCIPEGMIYSGEDIDVDDDELVQWSGTRQRMRKIAEEELGETDSSIYGAGSGEDWCAYFAKWVARQAGLGSDIWPETASTTITQDKFKRWGRWYDKVDYTWSYDKPGYGWTSGGGSASEVKPQPGDFVAIETKGTASNGPEHTGMVYDVSADGNTIYTIEGNTSKPNGGIGVAKKIYTRDSNNRWSRSSNVWIVGFGDLGIDGGSAPEPRSSFNYNFEEVKGGGGEVNIAGWIFDESYPSRTVELHVYVGGDGGDDYIDATGGIMANLERPDVNNAYNCGNYHGFDGKARTSGRGWQTIYVYAIGNDGVYNPCVYQGQVYISDPSYTIAFDKTTFEAKEGSSVDIGFKYARNNSPKGIHLSCGFPEDTYLTNGSLIENKEVSGGGHCTIRYDAVKAGSTTFMAIMYDENNNEIYRKNVSVKVVSNSIPPTGVTLDKTSMPIEVGKSGTLTATITPSNATNKNIAWSSSNSSVAVVSNSGVVTGKTAGTATITAKTVDGGKTAVCTVTVEPAVVAVTGVKLNKNELSLDVGRSETLYATVSPSNATDKTLEWSSQYTNIATVDSNGKVTAVSTGTTWIYAKAKSSNIGYADKCKVTVTMANIPPSGITLSKADTTIDVGKTETLKATIFPSNSTNKSVGWSSDNTSVATVSTVGTVTAKAPGVAIITVKTKEGGFTACCKVTVVQPVTGIELNKSSSRLAVGNSEELTATITPANATNKAVIWETDDSNIATVSSKGVVTGKSAGKTTIRVRTKDGNYYAECAVNVYVPLKICHIDKVSTMLLVNETEVLAVKKDPVDAGTKSMVWSSDNEAVATVSPSGTVKGISKGVANIKLTIVSSDNKNFVSHCAVYVVTKEDLISKIINIEAPENVDKGTVFEIPIEYYNPDNCKLEIKVNDESVMRYTGSSFSDALSFNPLEEYVRNGKLEFTAIKEGKAEISVMLVNSKGAQDTRKITIEVIGKGTTPTPTLAPTATPTPTAAPTPSPSPTETPTPTPTQGITPTPTTAPTPLPTEEPDEDEIQDIGEYQIAARQKLDLSAEFKEVIPDGVVISRYTVDNKAVATVSNKGIITGKKDGEVIVSAYKKEGRQFIEVARCTVIVHKPIFTFSGRDLTYIGDSLDVNDFISNLPDSQPVSWSIPKNCKVVSLDPDGGEIVTLKAGTVRVTCMIGEGKNAAKYTASLKIRIPKLAKSLKVKAGKSKNITLKNVSAYTEVDWDADSGIMIEQNPTKPFIVKVTGVTEGESGLTAYVDGQVYTMIVTVK